MKESLIFGFVCLFSYLGRILLTTLLYTNNAAHMYVCGSRAQICKFGMDRCLDVLFIISDSAVNLTHSISDSFFFIPLRIKHDNTASWTLSVFGCVSLFLFVPAFKSIFF